MKEIIKALSVLLFGLVMTIGISSCGDDNVEENKPKQPTNEENVQPQNKGNIVDGVMEYKASCADLEAMKGIASDGKVYVKYIDAAGAVQIEEFKGTFSKTVNLKPNKDNELVAGLMVYVNDIDWEKAALIVGRKEIRADVTSKCTINYENYKGYVETCLPTFSTASIIQEPSGYQQALTILEHNTKGDKEKYGVVPFSAFGLTISSNVSNLSTEIWEVHN